MADLFNWIVLHDTDVDAVADALRMEITVERGWRMAPDSAAGAKHLQVWRSDDGKVVVDLRAAVDKADPDLAMALSRRCETEAAAYLFDGAGEVESVALFKEGASQASYELNDMLGAWEVTHAGRRIFYHEFDGTAEREEPRRKFDEFKSESYSSGPFRDLLLANRWQGLTSDGATILEMSFLEGEAKNEPPLAQIERGLRTFVEPLLFELGFRRGKASPPQYGAAVAYERKLSEGQLVRIQYSFDRDKVHTIKQLAERLRWDKKAKHWLGPCLEIGSSRSTEQFHPSHNSEHLERACSFLAAALACEGQKLAELAPELSADVQRASEGASWKAAAARYDELWRTRLVSRERPSGWIPAKQVFRGAQRILVETAAKERFSFKVDTAALPENGEIYVNGLWETSAGDVRARKLKLDGQIVEFDEAGVLLTEPAKPTPSGKWWQVWKKGTP